MIRIEGNPKTVCHGLTRRDLLHLGGLGEFGITLADWLAWRSAAATRIGRISLGFPAEKIIGLAQQLPVRGGAAGLLQPRGKLRSGVGD